MTLRTRLILDYICWIVLCGYLLYAGYTIAFALVGSFAAIYLYKATRLYITIKRAIQQVADRLYDDE